MNGTWATQSVIESAHGWNEEQRVFHVLRKLSPSRALPPGKETSHAEISGAGPPGFQCDHDISDGHHTIVVKVRGVTGINAVPDINY